MRNFIQNPAFIKFVKFCLVGLANTAVDFAVLNLLVLVFHLNVYLAATISFAVALANSYLLNSVWTFKGIQTDKKAHVQFIQFALISIIGYLINISSLRAFMPVFSQALDKPLDSALVINLAKGVATIIATLWNFFGSKIWVFKAKEA